MNRLIAAIKRRYRYPWRESMRYHLYDWLELLFPGFWCPGCKRFTSTIERRRQNTLYPDDESNHVTCCSECFDEVQAYWEERWDEYNSGRL